VVTKLKNRLEFASLLLLFSQVTKLFKHPGLILTILKFKALQHLVLW